MISKIAPVTLLIFAGCSSNSPSENDLALAKEGKLVWEQCQKDDDCTAVANAVCDPKAINKKYEGIFYEHYYGKKVEACELRYGHEEKQFSSVKCVQNKCQGVW